MGGCAKRAAGSAKTSRAGRIKGRDRKDDIDTPGYCWSDGPVGGMPQGAVYFIIIGSAYLRDRRRLSLIVLAKSQSGLPLKPIRASYDL
jgi:hypothetical protein